MFPKRLPLCLAWLVMFSIFFILVILSQTHSLTTSTLISSINNLKSNVESKILETKLNIKRKLPLVPPSNQIQTGFCNSSLNFKARPYNPEHPILYIITPTYTRREQVVEMVRMSHTLLHIDNVIWVIAEDSENCSPLVETLLQRFQMPYAHLVSPMPTIYKSEKYKPRGVASRRAGLDWVRKNHDSSKDGVIYFADDDNTYDLKLFEELRKTTTVSVFPVGFVGK